MSEVGAPHRRRLAGAKWAVIAAAGCAVAVLAAVAILVTSDDDDSGGPSSDRRGDAEGPAAAVLEDADVLVFVDRNASGDDRAAIEAVMDEMPAVEEFALVGVEESVEELGELFEDNEAILDQMEENADLLPTTYRLRLTSTDEETVDSVVDVVADMPGVLRAVPVS